MRYQSFGVTSSASPDKIFGVTMTCSSLRLSAVLTSVLGVCLAASRHEVAVRQSEADDVMTQQLLWTRPSRSLIQCATCCVGDERCVSFTVSPSSTQGQSHKPVLKPRQTTGQCSCVQRFH